MYTVSASFDMVQRSRQKGYPSVFLFLCFSHDVELCKLLHREKSELLLAKVLFACYRRSTKRKCDSFALTVPMSLSNMWKASSSEVQGSTAHVFSASSMGKAQVCLNAIVQPFQQLGKVEKQVGTSHGHWRLSMVSQHVL
ncbi:UNVERIFIED_CONTAM: hypothetical protein K2H54_059578 [Gekko kuhli]